MAKIDAAKQQGQAELKRHWLKRCGRPSRIGNAIKSWRIDVAVGIDRTKTTVRTTNVQNQFEAQLKVAQEQIEFYKDF